MSDGIEERVNELELRFMDHDHTIQELNEIVVRQEQAIVRLERTLGLVSEQLRSVMPSLLGKPDEEERPPHY